MFVFLYVGYIWDFSFIIDIMGICVYLFYVCFLVIMIGIILSLALCDNGLSLTYDNPFFIFYVFVLGYGYIILVMLLFIGFVL